MVSKVTAETYIIEAALSDLDKSKVISFLSIASKETILETIEHICLGGSTDLRDKVDPDFLVKGSIEAEENQRKNQNGNRLNTQRMLQVSAKLLCDQIKRQLSSKNQIENCLKLYDLIDINDNNRGFVQSMLRDCGKYLSASEVREVLNQIGSCIANQKKLPTARDLICAGYLEVNGAELAFVALEQYPKLFGMDRTTPYYEIIDRFKNVLSLVDVNDPKSLNEARAFFSKACRFPGEEKAKAAVMEVRPDLIGDLA